MIDWRDWQVDSNMTIIYIYTIYDCITFQALTLSRWMRLNKNPWPFPGSYYVYLYHYVSVSDHVWKGFGLKNKSWILIILGTSILPEHERYKCQHLDNKHCHYHTFEWNAHWNIIEHARSSCSLHLFTLFKVGSPNPAALKVTRLQLRFHWNRVDQHGPCLCAANARRSLLGPWPPGNAWVMLCWKTAYLHSRAHNKTRDVTVMWPWCHRDIKQPNLSKSRESIPEPSVFCKVEYMVEKMWVHFKTHKANGTHV